MRFVAVVAAVLIGLAVLRGITAPDGYAPAAAASGDLAPADIEARIGQTLTVTGTVDEVFVDPRSGTIFLDMGGPSNRFTGVIFPGDIGAFPEVSRLEGHAVALTGTVQLHKGKPEIVLRDASQLNSH